MTTYAALLLMRELAVFLAFLLLALFAVVVGMRQERAERRKAVPDTDVEPSWMPATQPRDDDGHHSVTREPVRQRVERARAPVRRAA
jgi:hypothetical protein